jgi:adenine/guanine phosphoribosyltransferase-like PRPP-binding protein
MSLVIARAPWPERFPDVIVHGELRARNDHPDFPAAKTGDAQAAGRLTRDLLSTERIAQLRGLIGDRKPLIVPVAAVEAGGFNAIPDAMAQALATALGLAMAPYDLRQANYVAHTKADGWHRLATPATFTGTVTPDIAYLLVDDHVGFGGTIANLRGYIEARGGHVIGMTTLTETRDARKIAIRPETRFMLESRHGRDLDQLWRARFAH